MSYRIKPSTEELKKTRKAISSALDTCEAVFEPMDFEVETLFSTRDEVAAAADIEALFVTVDPDSELFEERVFSEIAHAYSEMIFLRRRGEELMFEWQEVLMYAFSRLNSQAVLDTDSSRVDVNQAKIAEFWDEIEEDLSDELVEENRLTEEIKIKIGELIAPELNEIRDIEHFHKAKRSEVLKVGNRLFGEEK
ncbi:MAG: hypothetical protein H8Z69_01815 [Nanohaloarchaea archaeon]|nr:hypothetical protein [Candidatus Nanohaloarchaea archaeon]